MEVTSPPLPFNPSFLIFQKGGRVLVKSGISKTAYKSSTISAWGHLKSANSESASSGHVHTSGLIWKGPESQSLNNNEPPTSIHRPGSPQFRRSTLPFEFLELLSIRSLGSQPEVIFSYNSCTTHYFHLQTAPVLPELMSVGDWPLVPAKRFSRALFLLQTVTTTL